LIPIQQPPVEAPVDHGNDDEYSDPEISSDDDEIIPLGLAEKRSCRGFPISEPLLRRIVWQGPIDLTDHRGNKRFILSKLKADRHFSIFLNPLARDASIHPPTWNFKSLAKQH
jgi:hypothetical protein